MTATAVLGLSALPVRAAPARRTAFAGSAVRVQQRVRVNASRAAMAARAEKGGISVDSILAKGAEAWESAPNKPAVVVYGVVGVGAIYAVETVIHWPLLNVIIGFPLELLGVTTAGYLALRYLKDGEDPMKDLSMVGETLFELLPGVNGK